MKRTTGSHCKGEGSTRNCPRKLIAVCLLVFSYWAPATGVGPLRLDESSKPAGVDARNHVEGPWRQPEGLQQIPIWPKRAPDMDDWTRPSESVLARFTPEAISGDISETVFDVSSPTMTVFPPKEPSTGAAVIVFPGGGFRGVAITLEGTEICDWISSKGMTCVLSKYRVPGTNHYWNAECNCRVIPAVPRALQDAQRTIRLVRSKARELRIDPQKIGVMGFSAGGYLGAQTSNILDATYVAVDGIDEVSSRPDFAVLFFPGHLCRENETLDPGIKVTRATPPTFLLMAWDDPTNKPCNSSVYAKALESAGVPAEIHFFAAGGHAFGLRRDRFPDRIWPSLVENWLRNMRILAQ